MNGQGQRPGQPPPSYEDFNAVELFCPQCRVATPTRERLLLVLPDGELYEYRCAHCATQVGKRKVHGDRAEWLVTP